MSATTKDDQPVGLCAGTTKTGEPCRKKATLNNPYCAQHDPERTQAKRRRRSSTFGHVRKLPSGHFQAIYNHNGRDVAATFPTKADANAHLSSVETDLRRGAWIDPRAGTLTVTELAAEWLAANSRKRPSSRDRDESILRCHVIPVIGHRSVASVTRHDVQALVDGWITDKAPSSVGRQYSAVRAMFTYAIDTERIVQTPCRRIRLPQSHLVERPTLTPEQLEDLAKELGADQAVFMRLGAVLGLRWAEAAGITISRIDILGGKLTVDRQLARNGDLQPPKSSAGVRTLGCPTWLLDDLAALLARRGLNAADGDQLLFISADGSALDYNNWRNRIWVPSCKQAGVSGLRFHDLRSLAATVLVAAGVDVKTTQTRLGHSSSRTTLDLYARATAEADRKATDAVGAFFDPYRTTNARQTRNE